MNLLKNEKSDLLRRAVCNLIMDNKLSREEEEAYDAYIARRKYHEGLKVDGELFQMMDDEEFPTWNEIKEKYKGKYPELCEVNNTNDTPINLRRMLLVGAAACFFIVLFGYLFSDNLMTMQNNQTAMVRASALIDPASEKASLVLSDKTVIPLDTSTNDFVDKTGQKINAWTDKNGFTYCGYEAGKGSITGLNSVNTSNGNHYRVNLPDGTSIILNAASSISFPAAFSETNRKVKISSGEAYFNVSTGSKKPFEVYLDSSVITVYGTEFNVNAYRNGPDMATTLIKGSLTVTKGTQAISLHPGQQCVFEGNKLVRRENVDTASIYAWKNGIFLYPDVELSTIVENLARWYNVKFNFQGNVDKKRLTFKFRRNEPLQVVLDVLSASQEHFHYKISERIVQIYP